MSDLIKSKLIKRIPGIIRHDFPRKLIALLFALLVWFSVSDEIGVEGKITDVEVTFTLPNQLILLNDNLPKVTLKIEASEKRKAQLTASDFKIDKVIEFGDYEPGKLLSVELLRENIKGPSDVKIKKIVPNRVSVEVDRKITKIVDIKPKFNGKLHPNYSFDGVTLLPDKTKITGPMSIVNKIDSLYTKHISLDGVVSSFERSIVVENINPIISISGQINCQVTVEIYKVFGNRQFENIPIRVLMPDDSKGFKVVFI